jgi:hypothetical protein
MSQPGVFTPYSTIRPLLGSLPGWVSAEEQERIGSYQKYEEIYWSSEAGFVEVMRGDNDQPIFLPTARTLVNAVDRYTCPDFNYSIAPGLSASPEDVQLATLAFESLLAREAFFSQFAGNKLYGLIRGDALWHVMADPAKPLGKRLSLRTVDPASYFPVYDEEDPDRLLKVHLAEQITVDGQTMISRQTYEKVFDEADGSVVGIMRSHGIFKSEKWWELTTPERTVLPPELLPPEIRAIPVYHWKNFSTTTPFGSSEMRGLESVLAAINQAITDEDQTLAVEGLGIYATDGAGPVDSAGNEVDWVFGPGRVITRANGLRRISGATSVSPYGDHINRMERAAKESIGASDVAIGTADSATAESGVALVIRLGPMLANTGKKDRALIDLFRQFFYDLCSWITVYEEVPLLDGTGKEAVPKVVITPTVGDKIPTNSAKVVRDVIDLRLAVPPVISLRTAHNWLRAAGLDIPDDELTHLANEAAGVYDPLAEPTGDSEVVDEQAIPEEEVVV